MLWRSKNCLKVIYSPPTYSPWWPKTKASASGEVSCCRCMPTVHSKPLKFASLKQSSLRFWEIWELIILFSFSCSKIIIHIKTASHFRLKHRAISETQHSVPYFFLKIYDWWTKRCLHYTQEVLIALLWEWVPQHSFAICSQKKFMLIIASLYHHRGASVHQRSANSELNSN